MNKMKQLKRWLFPTCVLLVLALGSLTVWHSKPNPHFVIKNGSTAFDFALQSKDAIQPSGKVVQVLLNNKGAQLQNYGTVNVHQFCTPQASVELDAALLAELDQDLLTQGVIKLRTNQNIAPQMPAIIFNSELSKATAERSGLLEVQNNGTAYIKVQCPSYKQIKVSNRGVGRVDVLTSYVESVEVENLGVGQVNLPKVKTIQIDSRGTGEIAVGEALFADVKLYGVGTVTFANEPKINSTIKGMGKIKTNTPHPYQ